MKDYFSKRTLEYSEMAMKLVRPSFEKIDRISEYNTQKVMAAFREEKVSESFFAGTTGYGYDDIGRDKLDRIYARVFGAEDALVRLNFVNGTHAIKTALFSLVKPGDTILSVSGAPYDTLQTAIGISGDAFGTLKFYGVSYRQIDLDGCGEFDYSSIEDTIRSDKSVSAVIMQRSRGYSSRKALSIEEIERVCNLIKKINPKINVFVDNCYGEFTDTREPTEVGADLIAGSLIKNPGGSLAPTGGYICGRKELVERAAQNLTSPGIGGECGSTLGNNRLLYQGFFVSPHVVAQALKTSVFCSAVFELAGFETYPRYNEDRSDIIQVLKLGNGELMKRFCRGIQSGAPVDSFVTPEPWKMPGYEDEVIMAAGAFIQGASIELSADGPYTEPYLVFLQGGITFESGKLGVMTALDCMLDLE